jgi:hypothetical protein
MRGNGGVGSSKFSALDYIRLVVFIFVLLLLAGIVSYFYNIGTRNSDAVADVIVIMFLGGGWLVYDVFKRK